LVVGNLSMTRQSASGIVSARHRTRIASIQLNSATTVVAPHAKGFLKLVQNQALAVVDSCEDAIFATTLDGVIVSWNPAAERIYGYAAREIIGEHASILFTAELHNELSYIKEKAKKGRRVNPCKVVRIRKDGRLRVSLTISPIFDARGKILGASVLSHQGVSQKKSDRYLATHDPLTDLANYTSLVEAFEAELRRSDRTSRPFAVLLLDVDRLKEINDAHGHLVGTRALCRLAAILKRTCRSIDTAARYGGDEFAVLLVETDEAVASHVAKRITDMLENDAESPPFTVSVGIAVFPQYGNTIESLLAAADRSLYKNKLHEHLRARKCERDRLNRGATTTVGPERRRSERLLLDVALVVRGESKESKPFQERTFTISVSAHGVLLVLATNVALGQTLFLSNPHSQDEVEGRVVHFDPPFGGLDQVGIDFAKPAPEFWPVEAVPNSWRTLGI
jgi:diguanylate cyclase (GGDEF)-like protein/PAS domain S-box-containing protein